MAAPISFKQRLKLCAACSLALSATCMAPATAQQAQSSGTQLAQLENGNLPQGGVRPSTGSGTQGNAIPPDVSRGSTETITVRAQRRLLKEKDSPSAVTELGEKAISQVGVTGSIATLLRQAPSINVYQQGLGNNEPVISIRGTRGLETAQTLDDVPVQDLLFGGTGSFLQNVLGGRFNLDQISGVSIYPGVAYPDKNTFGTIGGTVAYQTKRPTNDQFIDVFGSIGSYGTYSEGFTINSGPMDGLFGTGDNAPKFLFQYSNAQNNGFVDYTPAKFNNVDFSFDKPYNDGLSKFQFTALFNTASGYFTPEPVPTPYLNQNGAFSNFPTSAVSNFQANQYATFILKDDTYINDYLGAGVTLFYENSDSDTTSYGNPAIFSPGGQTNPFIIGGANPFVQTPAGFGQQGDYGPVGPNHIGVFYDPQAYPYDGSPFGIGTKNCPAATAAQFAAAGQASPCGYNAERTVQHNDTYGIQPRIIITPPEFFGINNSIQIGGLFAKETQPNAQAYLWGTQNVPTLPGNLVGGYDGGTQRTIYQGYAQDKIELLDNTLHLTPGFTIEGTSSSLKGSKIFGGTPSASLLATPYCQAGNPCDFGSYKANKWDRDYLPFFNVSYDLDKVLPVLKGVSLYGSTGQSALFAPVGDFTPNLIGQVPYASIVHLYEGGIKYYRPNLVASIDYFYQKVDRDFGFFTFQSGPQNGQSLFTNGGQREFKGFEAAATYQVSPEWQLYGNVSHLLAKYLQTSLANVTVQEDQFGLVVKGDNQTGIPDWLSTFGVEYTHKRLFMDNDVIDARFQGQYTGHQYTSYDLNGTQNIGKVPGVQPFGTYQYYSVTSGDTTTDPHGGLSPFAIFNLDVNYVMPTPFMPVLKQVKFDLNILNLFNQRYFQYFYKQIAPSSCPLFTSGPFKGQQISNYGCTPQFSDGLPGQPFTVVFTATARF